MEKIDTIIDMTYAQLILAKKSLIKNTGLSKSNIGCTTLENKTAHLISKVPVTLQLLIINAVHTDAPYQTNLAC